MPPSTQSPLERAQEPETRWRADATELLAAMRPGVDVGQRMHTLARRLLDLPYAANALVGGPERAEELVLDLSAFDCVTLIENVLALARTDSVETFRRELVLTRYAGGRIDWRARNHYFSDWMRENSARGALEPRTRGPGSRQVETRLGTLTGLPERRVTLDLVPRTQLVDAAPRIADGTVVAFASTRARLDFFHVGLLFWEPSDDDGVERLVLYHAARSAGCVAAEPLSRFLKRNRTRGLALAAPRPIAR